MVATASLIGVVRELRARRTGAAANKAAVGLLGLGALLGVFAAIDAPPKIEVDLRWAQPPAHRVEYSLPSDPRAPFVTLSYSGGMTLSPVWQLHPDGTLIVRFDGRVMRRWTLEPRETEEIAEIIVAGRLMGFDSRAFEDRSRMARCSDCGSTRLEVTLRRKAPGTDRFRPWTADVIVPSLFLQVQRDPNSAELQALQEVANRLAGRHRLP